MPQTLTAKFEALHAERKRSWDPETLQRNVDQRQALVAAYDPANVVKLGDNIAPFALERSDGAPLSLDSLTQKGPVALIFFRFAGCPACNIALPHYDAHLRPALAAANVTIVAVSPHLPERGLGDIKARHNLGFTVASDRGNTLARRLGIAFVPHDNPRSPDNDDNWIGALTGAGSWELPQPAIVLIDQDHVVRFADVSPDWLRRTEPEALFAALNATREAADA